MNLSSGHLVGLDEGARVVLPVASAASRRAALSLVGRVGVTRSATLAAELTRPSARVLASALDESDVVVLFNSDVIGG